ncbi:flagellar type III secretion system pore protein FliP [Coprothermobacter platensis]|jgi:flagellar biosynthetic protein FliP|uniref:flagellar type III secretion system pore protein FliP n=1 Tax=Coprothermobacter platensis TaxID=108819 RepID=UPI0003AA75B8|nr:flagellar type III secretion system pore protein FliP [Coprothermobacter platensis]
MSTASPLISINLGSGGISIVQLIVLLTVFTLAPSLLMFFTSFLRILVVFGFMRSAIGLQQFPPAQVFTALALILTFMIMGPVFSQVYQEAWVPYSQGQLNFQQFVNAAQKPVAGWMLKQVKPEELQTMSAISGTDPKNPNFTTLASAFMLSELKTAFTMGLLLYLPFIALDVVIASVLMSLGMFMIPPAMISLPLKILLFVAANGWDTVIMGLVRSFH